MARNQRDIAFATFNLFNLQLPGQPMYAQSRPYDQAEFDAKIEWSARMLKRLDADVVAFQELWCREALEALFEAAGLRGNYQLVFIKEEGPWDGVTVACAVRRPWEVVRWQRHKAFPEGFRLKKRKRRMADIQADPPDADLAHAADEAVGTGDFLASHEDDEIKVKIDEFSRSPLQVTVCHGKAKRPDVPPIEVFCTHLKSKLPTLLDNPEFRDPLIHPHRQALGAALSTIRRVAEATALRVILNGVMAGSDHPTVVLGDLNDSQLSNALAILGEQPSYRVYAGSTAASANDRGLFTAVTLQQLRSLSDVYYTHEFKNVREVIDHVLVSEQFYDHAKNRKWSFREMRFWNDHMDEQPDPPLTRTYSDHGLVRAAFDWNPA